MPDFHDYCEVIFWNFERKNNVNYNFRIIKTLIEGACESENENHYYKPICILIVSIIECTLYDFLCRIRQERYEGINLSKKEKDIIRNKDLPKKLRNYIDICKKHHLLGMESKFYDELYQYNEMRNRIHIQNLKKITPMKEWEAWNKQKVKSCGRLLQGIFLLLCQNHPRPDNFHSNPDLNNFPTPWNKL